MPSLNSSMLSAAEYDSETQVLTITFKNGRDYQYDSVPQDEYDNLISASSAGKYFIDNIRDVFTSRRA